LVIIFHHKSYAFLLLNIVLVHMIIILIQCVHIYVLCLNHNWCCWLINTMLHERLKLFACMFTHNVHNRSVNTAWSCPTDISKRMRVKFTRKLLWLIKRILIINLVGLFLCVVIYVFVVWTKIVDLVITIYCVVVAISGTI